MMRIFVDLLMFGRIVDKCEMFSSILIGILSIIYRELFSTGYVVLLLYRTVWFSARSYRIFSKTYQP